MNARFRFDVGPLSWKGEEQGDSFSKMLPLYIPYFSLVVALISEAPGA